MKVLNKEVDSCGTCPCANRDMMDEPYCNILNIDGEFHYNTIHKDCPFSKPITSEVIESYGGEVAHIMEAFKEDILFWFKDKKYLVHIHNHDRIVPLLIITDTEKCCNMDVFKGTINNPIELEFILKSIGVIE